MATKIATEQHGSHPGTTRSRKQSPLKGQTDGKLIDTRESAYNVFSYNLPGRRKRSTRDTCVLPFGYRRRSQWTLRNWDVPRGGVPGRGKGCGPTSQRKGSSCIWQFVRPSYRRNWSRRQRCLFHILTWADSYADLLSSP